MCCCDYWDIFSQLERDSSLQCSEEEFKVFAKKKNFEVGISIPQSLQGLCQEKDKNYLLREWSNHSGFVQPTLGRK